MCEYRSYQRSTSVLVSVAFLAGRLAYSSGHCFSSVRIFRFSRIASQRACLYVGRIRPFNRILDEMKSQPDGSTFFHRLAQVVSKGRVLRYIDYQAEIPRNM